MRTLRLCRRRRRRRRRRPFHGSFALLTLERHALLIASCVDLLTDVMHTAHLVNVPFSDNNGTVPTIKAVTTNQNKERTVKQACKF